MANYRVTGKVTEVGAPVARRVKAFKGDKSDFNSLGEKVGDTLSSSAGGYSVPTGAWQGKTFVIAIDDESGVQYDPGAVDWIDPELGPGTTFYYSRVLFDVPQAFWQLDDVAPTAIALDGSPALLNGTYEGGPVLEQTDTPYSNTGRSVQFDGTAQAVVTPSVLSPIAGAGFCLEFSFKTSQSSPQVLFASRAFSYPSTNYTVLTVNQQGAVPAPGYITLALADGSVANLFNTVSMEQIGDNEWHHLVVIKQGVMVSLIYDGKTLGVAGTLTLTGPTHEGSSHVFARAPDSAPGAGLAGKLFALPLWYAAQTEEQAKVRFYLLRRPVQPYTDRIFGDNPVRLYALEEYAAETVALDLSGSDAHGAYLGGAAPGSDALCWEEPMATSMLVNGAGQRADVILPFSGSVPTTAFTLECWFKTTRTQKAYLLDRQSATNRLAIVLNEGAGGVEQSGQIQCFISPAPGLVYRVYLAAPEPAVFDGDPHCLGVIYSHPDIIIILDGVQRTVAGTIAEATVLQAPGEVYYLGAGVALDAATGFVGNISHFSVWDTALDSATVRQHYRVQQTAYEALVISDAPQAYWRLDELLAPINDAMGNYSNLGVDGAPAFGQPPLLPNDPGAYSIDFAGSSNVATFNGPIIHNRAEWSLEAWFRLDAWPTVSTVIMGQADAAGNNLAVFIQPTPNRVDCRLYNGSTWVSLPLNAELGRLYYIVFTKEATGLRAYVNGSQYATDPSTANADARTLFTIGLDEEPTGSQVDAGCQHLACYYHALAQDKIVGHFEAGFHQALLAAVKALAPAGAWPMSDQLNAVQAIDFSVNASHGVYASGALGGGPSHIPAEPQQMSAALQAANNSRIQVPALFSDSVVTSAYTVIYFLDTTDTGKGYLLDRADQAGALTRRATVAVGAREATADPNYVQVSHRGDSAVAYAHTQAPFAFLADGEPHMVAVTYDDRTVKLYVDGIELTVQGVMPGPEILQLSSTLDAYFGARFDLLQAEKFVGGLSFVSAWDGLALTRSDIENIYTIAGNTVIPDGYAAYVTGLAPDGFWMLQEKSFAVSAYDEIAGAYNGTYIDAQGGQPPMLVNRRDSRSAGIANLDSSRVEVPNVLAGPVTAYTVMFWFRITAGAELMDVWDTDNVGVADNRALITLNSDDGAVSAGYLSVFHQGTTVNGYYSTDAAHTQIFDGNPHHLAVIYDGSDIKFVLDGMELAASGSLPAATDLTRGSVMLLGGTRYWASSSNGFWGDLSHFAVWSNVALAVAEVKAAYLSAGAGMDRAGYASAVLSDAPDSFWQGQEAAPATTLLDSSGNGNDGTYVNCDGGGDSLIPNRSDLSSVIFTSAQNEQLDVTNMFVNPVLAYTIEFWFQTTTRTRRQYLWDREGALSAQRISIILNASVSNQTLDPGYIGVNHTEAVPGTWVSTVDAYPQIYDGKPHHFAVIYSEPNLIFLLDGQSVPVTNPMGDTGNLSNSVNSMIGQHKTDGASGFDGLLSHYSVWFDRALTESQAKAHYSAAGGLPFVDRYRLEVLSNSPDSFWEMQEASPASTLTDSSGNGNNGSYSGADGDGQFSLLNEPLSSSAQFLAVADALTVPNGFSTVAATTAYTLEFWFRTTNGASRMFLWDKKGGPSVNRLAIVLNASESNTTLDAGKISVVQNSADPDTWVSTVNAYPVIYDGQPHHLAFIYNEPDLRVFLDGQELPLNHDFGADIGILNDQVEAYVGRHMSDTSGQFLGTLSNYAVWFGAALNVSDVLRHYRAGGGVL